MSPGEGRLHVTLRADTFAEIAGLKSRLQSMAHGLVGSEGLVSVQFQDVEPFRETQNTGVHCRTVAGAASSLGHTVTELAGPYQWSEDCGVVIDNWDCGGCFFGIGAGLLVPPLHDTKYDFPDELLEPTAALWAGIARRALENAPAA